MCFVACIQDDISIVDDGYADIHADEAAAEGEYLEWQWAAEHAFEEAAEEAAEQTDDAEEAAEDRGVIS